MGNYSVADAVVPDSNSYLNFDFNAFWSHNESYYLSKLDEFDMGNFQGKNNLLSDGHCVHGNDWKTQRSKDFVNRKKIYIIIF